MSNKYGARKVNADGFTFDSQVEFYRYLALRQALTDGDISDLKVHPTFILQESFRYVDEFGKKRTESAIKFTPDFLYVEDGKQIVEDVKGKPTLTTDFRLRWRLLRRQHPELVLRVFSTS